MRVLITGGSKGSWAMRGRQFGAAIGATARAKPKPDDWNSHDVVVLVKRAPHIWYREAHGSRARLIWDVLDFWHQPSGNERTEAELLKYVFEIRDGLKIPLLIGATREMAKAIGGVYIPHHSRVGLSPAPIRDQLRVVGYDGSAKYLGTWRLALECACARLGLTFVVNPPDLTQVDLFVAFRGEVWDGWPCRHWKSGVKYVNAIAAGRPILTQSCAAFDEIAPPGGTIVEDPSDLVDAIASWRSVDKRMDVYVHCGRRSAEFTLERVASQYQKILHSAVDLVHA